MIKQTCLVLFLMIAFAGTIHAQQLKVSQIDLATSIEDRTPTGTDTTFTADIGNIFCFTQIQGDSATSQITHVWFHKGEEKARINLDVRSDNWRTWSSKNILNSWTGRWRVIVEDNNGHVLATKTFTIE